MEELKALAAFLPELEDPDFSPGRFEGGDEIEPGVMRFPFFLYSPVVERFIAEAGAHGWVLSGFNWSKWKETPEAKRLRDEEGAIAQATPEQLFRLLTVCICQERFVEGALAACFESGLILRIVRRAATLAAQGDG